MQQMNTTQFNMVLAGWLASLSLAACQHVPQTKTTQVANVHVGAPVSLQIEPTRVACDSAVPMQCLQAIDTRTQEAFLIWYDAIGGFYHSQGVRYQIMARPVLGERLSDPTAQRWVLESVQNEQVVVP